MTCREGVNPYDTGKLHGRARRVRVGGWQARGVTTSRRLAAGGLAVVLAAEVLAYVALIRHPDAIHAQRLALVATPLWLAAVWMLSRLVLRRRVVFAVVLGTSALLQIAALTHGPTTSDDDYRYAWDAKVQLAGVDPYRYAPADPALERLREPWLFSPPRADCLYPIRGGCSRINRPTVHTIYPPVAEAAFVAVRVVSFGGTGERRPMQVAGLLGSLLITWLLLRWGLARGRPWLAAVWAWCPVAITEYANNAHIDWLAALLVVIAFATSAVRRPALASALVGAAVAVKLYPALVLPSLMRRRPFLTGGTAVAVVVLGYVPHVAAVGSAVIGYLPGYLQEERYANGKRLLLIGEYLPHPADTVVGALIVLAVAVWAWRRGDPAAPQRSAVVVVGVAMLTFTPNYSWYSGLLLVLVALTGALEWLPVVVAPTFAYLVHSDHDQLWYLIALILWAVLSLVRHRALLRDRWPRSTPPAETADRTAA